MTEKSLEVVVCGHLCLDLLPKMAHVPLSAISSPGRLFEIGAMDVSTGGAVSNTGLALHRLGVNVSLLASVGGDQIGELITATIKAHNPVLTQHLRIKAEQAGSYTIVLSPERVDRIFLHCTGTNATFSAADVDYALAQQAKCFHFGYPTLLPRTLEHDGDQLVEILEQVYDAGTITSLDWTLPDPAGANAGVNWRRVLERTLPFVDVFVPSIEEIMFMLRPDDFAAWQGDYHRHLTLAYLAGLADEIAQLGRSAIVGFKLGNLGLYLCGGDRNRFARFGDFSINGADWVEQSVYQPAFIANVVGTTGAGDCLYAGLITALLSGQSLQDAARFACAVAASSVEAADATSGVPSTAQIQQRVDAGWQTYVSELR